VTVHLTEYALVGKDGVIISFGTLDDGDHDQTVQTLIHSLTLPG